MVGTWTRASVLRSVAGFGIALVGVVPMLPQFATSSAPARHLVVAPAGNTIPDTCATDATAYLNGLLAAAPKGGEITLAQGGCYLADATILLKNQTDVTINGNGAMIRQPFYAGGILPILQLSGDTAVTIADLTLRGPSDSGSGSTEGDYGLKLTGDDDVSISDLTVETVQGDWVAVYPAQSGALNRNISIVNSSFLDAGYHGVTIEAADGVTFDNDTFNGVGEDGVDLEYDIWPTVFVDGQPTQGAEDNVTFEHTVWSNVHGVWVTSLQGQQVQEDNLALIDNTLVGMGLSLGIWGNQHVPNSGLLIEGNVSTAPATGVWGGSIASSTASSPIWLTYVNNVRILDNTIPLFDGTLTYYPNHPYMAAAQVYGNSGVVITGNTFAGAKSTLQVDGLWLLGQWSGTPSADVDVCGDRYWVEASLATPACQASQGYWLATANGSVFAAGGAPSAGGTHVPSADPVVGIAATADGKGYWVATANGSIFPFGDAKSYGSLPTDGVKVSDIVAIAPTTDSRGYWLIGSDGGMFALGDAKYHGSIPGLGIHVHDLAGMVATPSGAGYLIIGADGGVFAFGATHFYGSLPASGVKVSDIRGILPAPAGTGYILVGTDGGAFVFGHGTPFHGSLPGDGIAVRDIVGIALTPDANGYSMAGANGVLYPFGDASRLGVSPSITKNLPVVAIAGA